MPVGSSSPGGDVCALCGQPADPEVPFSSRGGGALTHPEGRAVLMHVGCYMTMTPAERERVLPDAEAE